MTRAMFLQELRIALQGRISQAKVNENLSYYENYIIEESRKGKTEAQVIEELGDPRLIAKTIIETMGDDLCQQSQGESNSKNYDKKGFHINYDESSGWDIRYGRFKINSWYGYLLLALIFIIVLALLAQVAIVIIPVLVPLFLIGLILYFLFYGNRK